MVPSHCKINLSHILANLALAQFSTGKKVYGNLSDQDRIFTNLYKDGDVGINGALKRVGLAQELTLLG